MIDFSVMILWVMIFSAAFGMCSNAFVMVIRGCKQLREKSKNPYRFLILQLAIADFLFASSIPFTAYDQINDYIWNFGLVGCKLIKTFQSVTLSVTVGILTVMTFERYFGILKPFRRPWSIKWTTLLISLVWLYFTALMSPLLYLLEIHPYGYCLEMNQPDFSKAFTIYLFITCYVIPLIIIITINVKIVSKLSTHHHATDKKNGNTSDIHACNEKTLHSHIKDLKTKKKYRNSSNMLVIATFCFALFNLPGQLFWLWYDFGGRDTATDTEHDIMTFFGGLTFLHCCVNPIIYSATDVHFRKSTKSCFKRIYRMITCNDTLQKAKNAQLYQKNTMPGHNSDKSVQSCDFWLSRE